MTSTTLLLRRRAARRHLVREARPVHHRHAPVRARLQPRHRPAVADPHRLRRLPHHRRAASASWPRTHLGVRKDIVAVPLQHDTPDAMAQPAWRRAGLAEGRVRADPGRDHAQARRGRARLRARSAEKMARSARWSTPSALTTKGVTFEPERTGRAICAPRTARARRCRRRPAVARHATSTSARRSSRCPARRTAASPRRASRPLEKRTGSEAGRPGRGARGQADHLRRHPGPPGPGDHLPGVVRQRRPAAVATPRSPINVERNKPWHTLTGRMHFYLDHDWITELGEALPIFRPPLDMSRAVRRAGPGDVRRSRSTGSSRSG